MRKLTFLPIITSLFLCDAMAATRPNARGEQQPSGAATKPVSARAARTAPATGTVGTATGAKPVNRGRAATTTPAKPTVAARAATKQKVISSGTKITSAAKNVTVDSDCQAKYDGCMDSFCMIDNASGGRCICSNRNAELNAVLAEIEKLDQQSYQMATFGVEKIEMGMFANDAIAAANAAADEVLKKEKDVDPKKKKARKALDLSAWDTPIDADDDEEDLFGAINASPVDGKEGDALHRAAAEICVAQIPECKSDISMLQMMYTQRIKSDCSAYENSLKQQKNASAQKLQTAERALREAALEQLQTANKYDLGQCTIKFKECMQTTGGCGDDFSSCAVMSAMDSTSTRKSTSKQAKTYQIKGVITNIEISASTYDMLMSKKPLCESVTRSCVAVADQVWDTFLKEVAPQVKSAELIAEDKARQDCIGNISACFQKACKDNMDPDDKDGSYDMCLSRPGTMLNVCKIPLNNCGIDASSESKAAESNIWDFVVARLAAMRVNACTAEVKECLQSEDRCGEDYTQCIGLDTDSIIRMCPYDKLTGCQKVYGEDNIRGDAVYEELASMVQGIMLTIDNNFLTECQNAADEAMIKICGDTESCDNLNIDDNLGSRTLEYKICEYSSGDDAENAESQALSVTEDNLSYQASNCRASAENVTEQDLRNNVPLAGVLSGLIFWENVGYNEDGLLDDVDAYLTNAKLVANETERQLIKTELGQLQNNINNKIALIEADTTVQHCMTGREVQGMKVSAKGKDGKKTKEGETVQTKIGEKSAEAARFPNLTKQLRMLIAEGAINTARENYYKKYDEYITKLYNDFAAVTQHLTELAGEDALNIQRDTARKACLKKSKLSAGRDKYISDALNNKTADEQQVQSRALIEATMIVPFTSGDHKLASTQSTQKIQNLQMNTSTYYETRTSKRWDKASFDWESGVCTHTITTQMCTSYKRKGLFGGRRCVAWGTPTDKVTKTNMIIKTSKK